jgi:hypothetical protein
MFATGDVRDVAMVIDRSYIDHQLAKLRLKPTRDSTFVGRMLLV